MPLHPNHLQYDLARQLAAIQTRSRRNGKVARLPHAVREEINNMIDDGIPYKTIIEKFGPVAQHITEQNLSNWRQGGYQDYLKAQVLEDRARIQTETAADLVRDSSGLDEAKLRQTCGRLGLLQYFQTVLENGDHLARESMKKNPAKFITLINAICNLSNTKIALQKEKWKTAELLAREPAVPNQKPELPPPSAACSECSTLAVP